jgi:TolA-binding protein
VFTVHVDTRRSQVEVYRGVVEFVPTTPTDDALSVTAGQGADLRHQRVFALSSPKTASIRAALEDNAHHRSRAMAPAAEDGLSVSESREPKVALDNPTPTDVPGNHASAGRTRSTTLNTDARPETAAASPSKHNVPTIDSLIKEAQSCLIARDWMCASSRYQGILKHYPKRPESTAALISLARIELRHLGMPKKALDHYRTYQKRAPNGPMAEEALFGIAETYRRLGRKDLEQATLRRFIQRFPDSSQINRAHTRLRQLGDS